jgi:hypothetical protein
LEEKVAAPVWKTKNTAVGIRHADHVAPSIRKKKKVRTNFSDKRRSLDRYSSRADSGHSFLFSFAYFTTGLPILVHCSAMVTVSTCRMRELQMGDFRAVRDFRQQSTILHGAIFQKMIVTIPYSRMKM